VLAWYNVSAILQKLKGQVQCFSMQVVINKCFKTLKKNLAHIRLVVFEKDAKTA